MIFKNFNFRIWNWDQRSRKYTNKLGIKKYGSKQKAQLLLEKENKS